MAEQIYYSVFTKKGLELLTEAIRNGTKLGITSMAFGDGGGSLPVPNENFTSMVREVHRTQLNSLAPDLNNANWLRADAIIASATGGFNIRELGLYAGNVLVAYSNYPPTYKPNPSDGTARIMSFRMILQIDNTANFDLVIDPDVVLATIQFVNNQFNKAISTVNSIDELLAISDPFDQQTLFVKSYYNGMNKGGGNFKYNAEKSDKNDGVLVFNGWERQLTDSKVTPEMAGAINNKSIDSTEALQRMIDTEFLNFDLCGGSFGVSSSIFTRKDFTKISNGKFYVLDNWKNSDWTIIGLNNNHCIFDNLWADCNGDIAAGYFSGIDALKGMNGKTQCKSFIGVLEHAHYTNVTRCYGTRSHGSSPVFSFGGIDKCLHTKIVDCVVEFTGSMFFTQSAYNEVINPTCINCNDAGIAFNTGGAKFCKVNGGYVSNCRYGGIAIESNSNNIEIIGVVFRQPADNSVIQRGDILVSSFTAGESTCYTISIKSCKFYIDGTWVGGNSAYAASIYLMGAKSIMISGNDFNAGNGNYYKGSYHAFVYAMMDLNDISDVLINNNKINNGQTLKIWGGDTEKSYKIYNVNISNNEIDTTLQTVYFPSGNAKQYPMAVGNFGVLIANNIFKNTGTRIIDGNSTAMPSSGIGLEVKSNDFKNIEEKEIYVWDRQIIQSANIQPNSILKFKDANSFTVSDAIPTCGFYQAGEIVRHPTNRKLGWYCTKTGFFVSNNWTQSTSYSLDSLINANGNAYVCVQAGVSGNSQPVGTAFKQTEVDGTVVWKYLGSSTPTFEIL